MFNFRSLFGKKEKAFVDRGFDRFVISSPGSLFFVSANDGFREPLMALNVSQGGIALEYNGEFPKNTNINSLIQGTLKYPALKLNVPCSMRIRFMVPSVGLGALGLEFVQINKLDLGAIVSSLAENQ